LPELNLDPATTALVVIDLQQGIARAATVPHTGAECVARTAQIADALRAKGGTVIFVTVTRSADGRDGLNPTLDTPPAMPGGGVRPAGWNELAPELGAQDGDLRVTKRQWGAFYGTDLDLQLRRRGIRTIILTGIASHIGVESTARAAYEHGYDQVFVEDATASMSEETHAYPFKNVFPRMGRIRSTAEVLAALG
jgi:nicotinamidase-related amidase